MESHIRTGRVGGMLLAVGGVGFLLSGALHPRPGSEGHDFHDAMTEMLTNPLWPASHWIALVTGLLLVWGLWLLVDDGWASASVAAIAGARLAMVATLFMMVQWAVEIAARATLTVNASGGGETTLALIDAMQAVGWPAFGVGFGLLAVGVRTASPRWLGVLAAVGATALGLAGLLAQGVHILQAGVLFAGGHLLAVWMIWAGIRTART